VGDALFQETFRVRLDGALSNLIQLKMCLPRAGGLDWMACKGAFQSKPVYDSVKTATPVALTPSQLL